MTQPERVPSSDRPTVFRGGTGEATYDITAHKNAAMQKDGHPAAPGPGWPQPQPTP